MFNSTPVPQRAGLFRRAAGAAYPRRCLAGLALLLSSFGAQAQLTGTKTIDPAGAGPNNYPSFTAAVNALNSAGVGPGGVTFNVAKVVFAAPAGVPAITAQGTATSPIVFQEFPLTPGDLTDNPVVSRSGGNTTLTDAVLAISGGDYITFDGISVEATFGLGSSAVEFGYLVRNASATNGAANNTIRNARIRLDRTHPSSVGLLQSASAATTAGASGGGGFTATSAAGVNQNNTYSGLVIESAYRGIHLLSASTSIFDIGTTVSACTIGTRLALAPQGSIGNGAATVTAGIQAVRQNNLRVLNNEVQNLTVAGTTGYGISIEAAFGTSEVSGNRIHDIRNTGPTSTSVIYGLRLDVATTGTGHQLRAYNNFVYDITHAYQGAANATLRAIGIMTNLTASTVAGTGIAVVFNSVRMQNLPAYTASSAAFSQNATTGPVLTVRNNIFADFSPAQSGVAKHVAINSETATQFGPSGSVSNNNDLYVANAGAGQNGFIGLGGTTNRATLADWRTAVGQDAASVSIDPGFVAPTDLHVANVVLNGTAVPVAPVTTDIDGEARNITTPDIGADEFTPVANDVALVSIDAPTSPAVPGVNPVTVTVRNGGTALLQTATLRYVINGTSPVSQTFTGLMLAPGAVQQLSFAQGVPTITGPNTITVTAFQPNGAPDENPGNNTLTITFNQPTPGNDEPCTAETLALGGAPLTSSNSGASTSLPPGIVVPACSPAAAPRDVWFAVTPAGSSLSLAITGNAAGMVRLFTAPDCAAGPFTQVFCQSSGAANTPVGNVSISNLSPGTRYYVAISGYGSSDNQGAFTIGAVASSAREAASARLLSVFPNPSGTGRLTLRVAELPGAGSATLLNALGQPVRRQPLPAAGEHQLSTTGLAAGLYTLRVELAGQVLTRKVVLE